MAKFLRHIFIAALILPALLLSGCVYDDIDDAMADDYATVKEKPRVTLTIAPMSLGVASADVNEMIRSLRIMMINETTGEDGNPVVYLELNRYIDFLDGEHFSGPGEMASTFRYIFTVPTVPGKKRFYIVANEASVTDVKFQASSLPAGASIPDWISGATSGLSLSDFLNTYQPDFIPGLSDEEPEDGGDPGPEPGDGPADETPEPVKPLGEEFENLLKVLYYTPDFAEVDWPVNSGNKAIFLPYTSQYNYTLVTQEEIDNDPANTAAKVNVLEEKMYLVPNATKFRFDFYNFRPDPVVFTSVKISGVASNMFLFANINSGYEYMGKQKDIWWINWLEGVSSGSVDYFPDPDENGVYNQTSGWITEYTIPLTAYADETDAKDRKGITELVPEDNPWKIEGNTSNDFVNGPPSNMKTGYFYLPESRFMVTIPMFDDEGQQLPDQEVQSYSLIIDMLCGSDGNKEHAEDVEIGNLGSLFRNTSTLITIRLRDATYVGAYAIQEPWKVSHTNGNVIEEKDLNE